MWTRRVGIWALAGMVCVGALAGVAWYRASRVDVPALLASAVKAAKRGEAEQSAAAFDRVLEHDPTNSTALLYRAQIARDQGQTARAVELLARVSDEPFREGGTARFLEGTILLEADRAVAAERAFLRSIALHPRYLQPRERLTQLYILQLRGEEIRQQLVAIRELRPWTLDDLAIYHGALGFINDAKVSLPRLERFVRADPEDDFSRMAIARYFLVEERLDEAEKLLQAQAARRPEDLTVRGLLAECLLLQSKLDAAGELLGTALPPDDAPVWMWRSAGRMAVKQQDWPRGVACLQRVVAIHPDDLQSHYQLAVALERSGDSAASKRVFGRSRLVEEIFLSVSHTIGENRAPEPRLTLMVRHVGLLLARLERHGESVMWLEQALARNPQDEQAQQAYVRERERAALAATAIGTAVKPAAPRPENVAARAKTPPKPRFAAPAVAAATLRLTDQHAEAGIDFQYFNGGSGFKYLNESLGGGVSVLDFDGDHWPDLYFTQGCPIPNNPTRNFPFESADEKYRDRLYRNLGAGRFQEVGQSAGLLDTRYGQGCSAGDYNNDGFPDLFVANLGANRLYRNNGDGTFTDVSREAGIAGNRAHSSVGWSDLDRDGNLDVYVVTYALSPFRVCPDERGIPATCSPGNFGGEDDVLYRSRGDGSFEDVTKTSGILAPEGKGLGLVTADFDEDGWTDIYVANDGTPNFLFHNLSGESPGGLRFEELGMVSGTAVSGEGKAQAGMGIACGDFDGDSRLDLHVTNFFNEYNALYLNQGEVSFLDATREARLIEPSRPMLGFGTQALDVDLDGWLDIFVTNGHIDEKYAQGGAWKMPPQLYRNRGQALFDDVSKDAGAFFEGGYLGRGAARLDWNRDGRPDIIVVHQDRPVGLLRNDTDKTGHRIALKLRGVTCNRDGLGCRVRIATSQGVQVHELCGGDGFFASNEPCVIVGLGGATGIETLEVQWPGGKREHWSNLPADLRYTLTEGRNPHSEPFEQRE